MPRNQSLYMGTTKIEAMQTAGEIISELVRGGATSINTEYKDGKIYGIKWLMRVRGTECLFDMPIRVEPLLEKIGDRAQAERVAWRQLLRWVQAQNAMIEVGMAEAGEVYFAYMVKPGTKETLFHYLVASQFKALGPAS